MSGKGASTPAPLVDDPYWRPIATSTVSGQVRIDEMYREAALKEQSEIRQLAALLDGDVALDRSQRWHVALVLRHVADHMPLTPRKRRGHQQELNGLYVAAELARLTAGEGMSRTAAISDIAFRSGVSIEAIKGASRDLRDVENALAAQWGALNSLKSSRSK